MCRMVTFIISTLIFHIASVLTSPIVFPVTPQDDLIIPNDFCILPSDYGHQGSAKFIEDCDSLDQYEYLPLPGPSYQKYGTHPLVCCPKKIYKSDFICLPTDAWCPSFDNSENSNIYLPKENPITMASKTCYNTSIPDGKVLSECVPINRCTEILNSPDAPVTVIQPCGFDKEQSAMMICCPKELTTNPVDAAQKPRFPVGNILGREARPCEDKHEMCSRWKDNGGCALDQDFVISELGGNGRVTSGDMFGFMEAACPASCGWCGEKGCIDEHSNCKQWSRAGMCVLNPFVMAHMCRESCGVCGFLSAGNNEDQVKNDHSYTDFSKQDFHCGQFDLLSEINGKAEDKQSANQKNEHNNNVFCGATMISDRWAVTAAHCYENDMNIFTGGQRQVRVNTIRQNTENKEIIEIKRRFLHPLYTSPSLYNDIAVLELGRRVEYDFAVFGDSPSCLDQGIDVEGSLASIQGFALNNVNLLENNVTIISNEMCQDLLNYNKTTNPDVREETTKDLPQGLNSGILCAQGSCVSCGEEDSENKTFEVNAGGPLTVIDNRQRSTLVGIGSGGVQDEDRKGFTGWFTRVRLHVKWIQCIIKTSKMNKSMADIQRICKKTTNKI